jgi:hypothetical protein
VLDKYNLSAYFFDGQVKIGNENDLEVFLLAKKNTHGIYEVSCSADRMADPIYHPKSGESFALTAAAQKSFTERSCSTSGWGMQITKLSQNWEKSKKQV